MAINITVERAGIPVEIDAKQKDGSIKKLNFFIETDVENLLAFVEMKKQIVNKANDIQNKYPVFNGKSEIKTSEDVRSVLKGLNELLEPAYQKFLGDGSYEQIKDAGIGSQRAFELFAQLADSVSSEIDKSNKKLEELSQKQAMKYAVKKKAQKN